MTNKIQTIGMMETMLKEINKAGGIEASAIGSRDGLLICTTLSDQNHAEIFVAMSATMIGAAETASAELGKGIPELTIVESGTGKIIGTGAGPKALLLVMAGPDANLGLVLFEMKKASEKIRYLLG
ncbi:MAG: distant relative of homeotic protein bithoraxoid [Candidatus Methanoperedenaceae archaeon]|nr:MAG: distant relative of homeotic protein bithoraxoid [Candidatus Methanoperedenaceae archaeon]